MKPETAAKIKYGVWGLICGAVIAMIIGFAWGGWTTSGTTQTMTKEAVVARELKSLKKVAGIRCPGKKRLAML
jgi:hypothetical protein